MTRFLCVCAGGAAGSGLRYLLATWADARMPGAFPWGILVVNLLGCFGAGLLGAAWAQRTPSPEAVALVTTGFLGGFTTYSSFNHGLFLLTTGGRLATAAVYLATTVLGCVAAGLLGVLLGRSIR